MTTPIFPTTSGNAPTGVLNTMNTISLTLEEIVAIADRARAVARLRLLTAAQVAELLQCTTQTVEIAARDGRLPGIQYGRAWQFPEDALIEALRLQALANLKAALSPAPAQAEGAHAFTAPPSRRKAANNSRTRPRPQLIPLTG